MFDYSNESLFYILLGNIGIDICVYIGSDIDIVLSEFEYVIFVMSFFD